ncbi:MAG TPA: hypothetical protein VNB90_13955 [Cytophagaceae bacterium]|nr:hypothetical protein [Cytophagaceae bacterium]
MMKTKILMLSFLMLLGTVLTIQASPAVDKAKAKIVLMKTNRALGVAHMTVKKTRKFSGKLGKAVKHARYAKKQYLAGNYDKSVYHSLYARKLALEVMQENGAKTGSDFVFSADENAMLASSPSADELAKEVNTDNPAELKDEELMNGNLDVDVI